MNLDTLIAQVRNILPSPQILPRLLTILEDPDSHSAEVVDIIKLDPALTAQVLALSNSAFYGYSSPSIDLDEAVNRIGFKELYKLVGLVLCKRLVGQSALPAYQIDEGELWENSIACAFAMEKLAAAARSEPTMAYTLGLMQGLGKIVINQYAGDAYLAVFDAIESRGCSMLEAESGVFGFDHARTCEALLAKWNFPEEISVPVAYQYRPAEAPLYREPASMLHLAKWIVSGLGANCGRDAFAFEMDGSVLEILDLSETHVQLLILEVQERLATVKCLLQSVNPVNA